ncbi:DUF4350 domain-containing protein [Streptomyces sp. NPDC059533]|uniref:DUF4350 domain-containing protein n=1 Tax=unclassified Streptomyces TaxID=2593676 RepID=UPI0036CAD0AC
MTPPNEPPAEVNATPEETGPHTPPNTTTPTSGPAGKVPGHPRTTQDATTAPPSAPWPGPTPEEPPRHTPGPTGSAPSGPHTPGPAASPAAGPQAPAGTTPPSGPHTPSAPQAPATAPAATPATRRARRIRTGLVVLGVLAAGVTVLAALSSGTRHGLLDPRSADPYGSRAVSELLKERGVSTRVVTTAREAAAATGPRTTLLVTDPDRLGTTQRRKIAWASDLSGGRTILIGPTSHSLTELAYGVHTKGDADPKTLAPDCAFPAATTAGRAGLGDGLRYTTSAARAIACYPSDGHPTLLVLPTGTTGGDTVVLGTGSILLNQNLADEGNASLALQLLGSRPDLVWYMPTLEDSDADSRASGERPDFLDLIPAGWSWALLQLFVAAALAALWRARRLGPLVTEKLPVVIRASEATEGRARLYRKARARDRAATVLRAAARERLAALTGVAHTQAHDPAALAPAVSARLTGGTQDVTGLLFGPTPSDDAALVALADHLDALEREVRTS